MAATAARLHESLFGERPRKRGGPAFSATETIEEEP